MKKILIISFVILALFTGTVRAQENIEKKKIEFLISSVENLKGV
jgi:fumarate reductase subunit D